jgi:hypothetical protein
MGAKQAGSRWEKEGGPMKAYRQENLYRAMASPSFYPHPVHHVQKRLTYGKLLDQTKATVDGGRSVIVDASCLPDECVQRILAEDQRVSTACMISSLEQSALN